MAVALNFHPDARARTEMLTQMWANSERRASQAGSSIGERPNSAADRPATGYNVAVADGDGNWLASG